jgi:hypothetical protein
MNQLITYSPEKNCCFSHQRRIDRYEVSNLLAITQRGTGQILDISREGLSFGCLYPHAFPDIFYLDILDAKGSHIKRLKVRKIWEINDNDQESVTYESIVGAIFVDLTVSQADDLSYLFDNMEGIDYL